MFLFEADFTITVNDGEPKLCSDTLQPGCISFLAMECTPEEWDNSFDVNGIKTIRIKGTLAFDHLHCLHSFSDYQYCTEKLGDFSIVAENHEFKVRKSVLIASSTVFAAMFESEYQWKEKEENKYEIQDFPFKIVETVLHFCSFEDFYFDWYHHLEEYILLYKFADKYDIKKLKIAVIQYLPLLPHYLVEYSNSFHESKCEELLEKCFEYYIVCKSDSLPIKDLELLNVEVKNYFITKMFSNASVEKILEPSVHKTYQRWADYQNFEGEYN
uniref:BTB domain-containing protein n=1 Tax=Panagrolaimus sp. ES5 TaxID=591445 RepID=A0AC34G2U1_9BILA